MRGDGWANLIFDDWDDFDDYRAAHGEPRGTVIIGGRPVPDRRDEEQHDQP